MQIKSAACLFSTLLCLAAPLPSWAEMTLIVSGNGDGTFVMEGENVTGVESVKLNLGYDTTFLANPQVGLQGGAVNGLSGNQGRLDIGIVREDPAAGLVVELLFDAKGDGLGVLNYVAGTATDTEGRTFPVRTVLLPVSPPPKPSDPVDSNKESSLAAASSAPGGNGAVPETAKTAEPRGAEVLAEVVAPERETAARGDRSPERDDDGVATKSVFQRFREYRGERGLQNLAALFRTGKEVGRQEPAIALSDGKTPVRILLDGELASESAPNLALSDAKFLSLQRLDGGRWKLTIMPNQGACEVRLIVRAAGRKREIPLVVAPPVAPSVIPEGGNFAAALAAYLKSQARWGFPVYLHEYVFTANYLAREAKKK